MGGIVEERRGRKKERIACNIKANGKGNGLDVCMFHVRNLILLILGAKIVLAMIELNHWREYYVA